MANKLEIDVIANDLASAALDLVKNKLMDIGGKTALIGTAAITMGAAVVTGLSKAKDAAQAYDQQVKELMVRTGGTAEETSRLIQTVDDAGISYETLSTAMRFAVKNGIEPNIESIARLSTEYNALNGPVEKGQFLLDKFGRSGMDMARIMDLGGDAIMNMSQQVEKNLIVTDDAIKASEEYRINTDNLTDSFEGLKVKIGNEVIPVLNNFMEVMQKQEVVIEDGVIQTGRFGTMAGNAAVATAALNIGIGSATNSYIAMAMAVQNTGSVMTATEPNYQQMITLTQQLEGATIQAANSITYNMLMAKLAVGGLDQAEYELGLQAGVSMGIFSQKTADTARKINEMTDQVINGRLKVDELKKAIDSLESKSIEIDVSYTGNYQYQQQQQNPNNTYNIPGMAVGGHVSAGRPYIVGEAGQELFVPSQSGRIIPNGELGGGGGAVVNLTYAPQFSTASRDEMQNILLPFIIEGIRQANLR